MGTVLWMTGNLCEGFCARMDQIRKWSFGTVQLLQVPGTEGGKGNIKLRGCFVMRDPTQGADQIVKSNPDAEYWTWTKVDLNTEAGRNVVTERWSKIYEGNTTSDGLNAYDAWEMKQTICPPYRTRARKVHSTSYTVNRCTIVHRTYGKWLI